MVPLPVEDAGADWSVPVRFSPVESAALFVPSAFLLSALLSDGVEEAFSSVFPSAAGGLSFSE